MEMPIIKLKPACKDYIWGGSRLRTEYKKESDADRIAETWELSCHPDGPCTIVNGDFAGKTLEAYIEEKGCGVLGTNCVEFDRFPILIKLIDAQDNLSIQVHPSDAYALEKEGEYGKTEMWYVMDCEEDSCLYHGFSREISKEEFSERIRTNSLLSVLNRVPVHKGDVFFIEAGTIHAIGKGILIAEIQQNSNLTYRVFDYGRKDANGNTRELHIEKALEVANRIPPGKDYGAYPHLGQCRYFTVDRICLDGTILQSIQGTVSEKSFLSLLFLEGTGTVENGQEVLPFQKGDCFFLPAGSGNYMVRGCGQALVTSIGTQ